MAVMPPIQGSVLVLRSNSAVAEYSNGLADAQAGVFCSPGPGSRSLRSASSSPPQRSCCSPSGRRWPSTTRSGGFLTREVFAPLGMDRTFAGAPHRRDEVARGYAGDTPVPSFELDSVGMGAGDVWSTTSDMRGWNDGLHAGRLLGAESLRRMFTEQASTGTGPPSRGYGYGWFNQDHTDPAMVQELLTATTR